MRSTRFVCVLGLSFLGTLVGASAAAAQPTAPAQASVGSGEVELFDYVVQEGDSCASISERFFGSRRRYDLIHAYNPGMGPPPHELAPGRVLRLPRRATPAAELADATVTGVERRVEARPRPVDEAWVAAQRGLGLYRGGRVATQTRSAAELTFRDTSVVQLREDTLVIIFGPAAATTRRAGMEATLETGALRTRLGELRGEGAGGNTLRVVTGSGTAMLEGGSAVVSVDPAGTSRLSNHSSQARLQGAAGGRAVPLPADTGSLVRRGERPTPPRPLPAAPRWTSAPADSLGYAGSGGSIAGEWAPVPSASRYRVEISRLPDGRDVVVATEVPANVTRFEASGLPAGTYHVFLSTLDGELFESRPSAAHTLQVVEARILAPGEDPRAPAPAFDPGDPSEERAARAATLEGSVLVLPDGVHCAGEDGGRVALRALDGGLACTDASGERLTPSPISILAVTTSVDGAAPSGETLMLERRRPRELVLSPVSDARLPDDLTLTASEGILVAEARREADGFHVSLAAASDAPAEGELRWVSAHAPRQVMGRLPVRFAEPTSAEPPRDVPAPATAAAAPYQPRLTEAYARSPLASALALTDVDRRGSLVGLALAEIAPRPGSWSSTQRTRVAIAGDLSLFDDALQLGTLVPVDLAGSHGATWERGSLDVYAHARWVPLRRDPTAAASLALAIDIGAWFPTHASEPSGLPVVRLAPSIELAYAFDRVASFRMRQGALLDLDATGGRLWASAYGLDVSLFGPIAVGVELDLVLGPEIEADLFALALSPQLSVDLHPVVLGLGMRFGLNRDGQALFGAASVALSGSVAFE